MNDTDLHDPSPLAQALREQLQAGDEPADAGFSLRVMAALPPRVSAAQRRRARWLRWSQWGAITLAGCGAAMLLAGGPGPVDAAHLLAGLALVALLILWTVPSPWNRR